MAHLLQLDSSISGDRSVSRALTARAAAAWRAANPGGTVGYRDLGADPVPHLDATAWTARLTPEANRTPELAAAARIGEELVKEVLAADVVLLGLPLYNYGAPSSVKAWVDRIIAGAGDDPKVLGGRELVVLASRGGGYQEGAPRHGWDHAEGWLPHGLSLTGLAPRFITAEFTLADVNPALAEFRGRAAESLAAAEAAIDRLWAPVGVGR
ncbi:FMN-dependent NADH-azoreductase [Amycolatopsis benzoatilytica]|uniref:FMN-dependent NADH-azoreductase n=1 Tax=Amycolatopsis benzoatilytica TaxID=346045 RepID=UPI00039CC8FF|nr:NAD(P)H-dependent oxidoreductase [Amycolatopsis benzoatilytica]